MRVVARLGWEEIDWGTPLARALVAGTLPAALRPPVDLATAAAGAHDIDPKFLADLISELEPARRGAWEPLRAPGARAVVTGQQPGCAGGILLVLYKAATAVAQARRASRTLERPVVPVFWNATDDEDFDEIARVAWPDVARGLSWLELPRTGRQAAGWVGDLPADGDIAAVRAALELAPASHRAALAARLPATAADHGAWVAAFLAGVFPELAILDARSPALRRHGAPLFARYLHRRTAVVEAVEAATRALETHGFAPTLAAPSVHGALYLTPQRRRLKMGNDSQPLLQALERSPIDVSPNVVLRPLLQDALLPALSHVVGPSEIGYLFELRPLRALLEVPEPLLSPRLSLTAIAPEAWNAAQECGLTAAALIQDPEGGLARYARTGTAPEGAQIAAAFAAATESLAAVSLSQAARSKALRRLQGVQADLVADLEAAARAALGARAPQLAALPNVVRPRGQPQERLVAALWLLANAGEGVGDALLALAEAHLEALAAGRGEHALVVL